MDNLRMGVVIPLFPGRDCGPGSGAGRRNEADTGERRNFTVLKPAELHDATGASDTESTISSSGIFPVELLAREFDAAIHDRDVGRGMEIMHTLIRCLDALHRDTEARLQRVEAALRLYHETFRK